MRCPPVLCIISPLHALLHSAQDMQLTEAQRRNQLLAQHRAMHGDPMGGTLG